MAPQLVPPPRRKRIVPEDESASTSPGTRSRSGSRRLNAGFGWKAALVGSAYFVAAELAAAVLGAFAGAPAGWTAFFAVVLIGLRLRWRARRGSDEPAAAVLPVEGRNAPRPAFRGLYPFEAGERLPGERRAWAAQQFAAWVAGDGFCFGVLCGESGCGKTSLVRTELTDRLRESGWEVRYFDGRDSGAGGGDALAGWGAVLEEMDSVPPDAPAVFILDQFEKLFAAVPEPEARSEFGARVQRAFGGNPRLRVLAVIPAAQLWHVKDLAPGLPNALAGERVTGLKFFADDEARDVILECGRTDGLEITPALASALAHDLAEDGRVRPTELQIVCTYLGRSFTEERYRLSGGAAGIVAHHVRHALERADPPEVAARLLRAMCDFGALVRRKPVSLSALIAEAAQSGGKRGPAARDVVQAQLAVLEDARIVRRGTSPDGPESYELVHDYLVQAVAAATSTSATRTEEANQKLRYYVRSGERSIGFFRAWRIRKHADPDLLRQEHARRLVMRSLVLPVAWSTAAGVAALGLGTLAWDGLGRARTWNGVVVDRHPGMRSKEVMVAQAFAAPRRIITGDGKNPNQAVWDSAGRLLRTFTRGGLYRIGPNGRVILVQVDAAGPDDPLRVLPLIAVRVGDGREDSIPSAAPMQAEFADSGRLLTYFDSVPAAVGAARFDLVVYSLERHAELGRIPNPPPALVTSVDSTSGLAFDTASVPAVSPSGDRLIVSGDAGGRSAPELYDVRTGRRLAVLRDAGDRGDVFFAMDGRHRQVVTAGRSGRGQIALRRWSLDTGRHLGDRRLEGDTASAVGAPTGIAFGPDGSMLLVSGRAGAMVVQAGDLTPRPDLPVHGTATGDPWTTVSGDAHTTRLWDLRADHDPVSLPMPRLKTDFLSVSADGRKLLVRHPNASVELWDLATRRLVSRLAEPDGSSHVWWSSDTAVVILKQKGGMLSLFDGESGSSIGIVLPPQTRPSPITYDRACRQVTVWEASGQVRRYSEGLRVLGHFWPLRWWCRQDRPAQAQRAASDPAG
jgi:hypothetical protein